MCVCVRERESEREGGRKGGREKCVSEKVDRLIKRGKGKGG